MKNVRIIEADALVKALLSSDGVFPLTVTGSSMAPLLKDGRSTVLLTKDFVPKRGRILLFRRRDGSLILHRVRKIDGNTLVMNGDAQDWCERILPHQVIAAVEYIKNGQQKREIQRAAAQNMGLSVVPDLSCTAAAVWFYK